MGAAISVPARIRSKSGAAAERSSRGSENRSRASPQGENSRHAKAFVSFSPETPSARSGKKEDESISASCALSRSTSLQETVVNIRASYAPVSPSAGESPVLVCESLPENFRAARSTLHSLRVPSSTSGSSGHQSHNKSDHASQNRQQQQQQQLSRRTSRSPTNVSTPMYGVDVIQVECTSPHQHGIGADLDDFDVAYSRGVRQGDIVASPLESIAAVQYIHPPPSTSSRTATGPNASLSGAGQSLSAPELGVTYPPLCPSADVDETLAFVTLRRAGYAVCRSCAADLPYQARFCPQCGTNAEASGKSPTLDNASRVSSVYATSLFNMSMRPTSSSTHNNSDNASDAGSAAAATPRANADDESLVWASNVFTQQRHDAYVRHVKVLRSRPTLGSGTSGTVYRAIDTRNGQQLAVKESLINQNSPNELAAVRNELQQLAELRHPYIVEYFGCRVEAVEDGYVSNLQNSVISSHLSAVVSRGGSRRNSVATRRASFPITEDSLSAFMERDVPVEQPAALTQSQRRCSVEPMPPQQHLSIIRVLTLMERVECGTLSALLAEFPHGLPEQAVRRFAAQLIDAVCYVHESGFSHRDIKLDNILLASDGTIRLSDFGCAVRGVNGLRGNGLHSIAGTPAYMPPESLSYVNTPPEDWTVQGKAQDVWAIGCVVHHLLTAKAPWSSMRVLNPFALLLHIQTHDFPICKSALSREALDFCRRCFERDPEKRSTVAELAAHPFVNQGHRQK